MSDWFDVRAGDIIKVKDRAPMTVGSVEIDEPPETSVVIVTEGGRRYTYMLDVPFEFVDRPARESDEGRRYGRDRF